MKRLVMALSNGVTVYVFGNPDLPEDSLPIRLISQLHKKFPNIVFVVKDPNEEWDVPKHLIAIDTAVGIDRVQEFHSLESFHTSPRVSMHDFDALAQLRLLQKIGKLKKITIIGVPPKKTPNTALEQIAAILARITE